MGTEKFKHSPETVETEAQILANQHEELVHLDVKVFYEDFNFDMEDGSCAHFEFQSTNEGLEGLKRFRAYEALYSYQHKVPVTTYVLFSGKIQKADGGIYGGREYIPHRPDYDAEPQCGPGD